MERKERIKEHLSVLKPHFLEITNESHLHLHHKQNNGRNDSHFKIIIGSNELDDLTLVQKHKVIHELLKEELNSGLHALSIKIIQ